MRGTLADSTYTTYKHIYVVYIYIRIPLPLRLYRSWHCQLDAAGQQEMRRRRRQSVLKVHHGRYEFLPTRLEKIGYWENLNVVLTKKNERETEQVHEISQSVSGD